MTPDEQARAEALIRLGYDYANQLADSTHVQHAGAELVGDLAAALEAAWQRSQPVEVTEERVEALHAEVDIALENVPAGRCPGAYVAERTVVPQQSEYCVHCGGSCEHPDAVRAPLAGEG